MKPLALFLLLASTAVAADKQPAAEDSITVKVLGTLRTGIVAIGGETTGTTITSKGITWELDFGKFATFRKITEKLNGKKVIVRGSLERRKGVEIEQRWIVKVTSLKELGDKGISGFAKPDFQATVGRADTRIRFLSEGYKTVIAITSRSGIDKATIKRESEKWPKSILVRLNLRGLESFTAGNEKVAVEWSVSSTEKNAKRVSLREGREELALDEKSPYHTEVRIGDAGGKGTIKLLYFEVPLPAKLFEENPKEISLRWIDFYRN